MQSVGVFLNLGLIIIHLEAVRGANSESPSRSPIDEPKDSLTKEHLKIFYILFKKKRGEHREAINIIQSYNNVKQYELIETIFERATKVLDSIQVRLRESGYIPGMEFPTEDHTREALALCLENTAFLSDIVLHFPSISHQILSSKKSWNLTLTWGIFFATQAKFLDKKTLELMYLVSQELGLADKDPHYNNPYGKVDDKIKMTKHMEKGKMKRKKSFKKGPRLSRNIDEL